MSANAVLKMALPDRTAVSLFSRGGALSVAESRGVARRLPESSRREGRRLATDPPRTAESVEAAGSAVAVDLHLILTRLP